MYHFSDTASVRKVWIQICLSCFFCEVGSMILHYFVLHYKMIQDDPVFVTGDSQHKTPTNIVQSEDKGVFNLQQNKKHCDL